MAIPIKKFGQHVVLKVHDDVGNLVFETDSLKIDFDIRHINGWSRAKISLTNLAPDTIRKIGNSAKGNYVTVLTSLHDSALAVVADSMYISNAFEEIKVPQSIFNMYCVASVRKKYLEKDIDLVIKSSTLKNVVSKCVKQAGFEGVVEYKHFPDEILNHVPPSPFTIKQGTLISVLELMGQQYGFNHYTDGNNIVLMYKPDSKNVSATSLYKNSADIVLATSNMRSNPKIGPATLTVVSNLDPAIKPSSVLDISKLLTLGTDTDQVTLEVAEDYLKEKVAGFSKYQALTVQHKGSNWSKEWSTTVAATSPSPGLSMPTNKWWA